MKWYADSLDFSLLHFVQYAYCGDILVNLICAANKPKQNMNPPALDPHDPRWAAAVNAM